MNQIKYFLQRIFRGYDDRINWSFESYLYPVVVPALKGFCSHQLENVEHMKQNPERKEVYEKTIQLINDMERMDFTDAMKIDNQSDKFWSYFGSHIGYYWD